MKDASAERCLGVARNRGKTSDGSHCSRKVAVLLLRVSGRRLGADFLLLRANIGINANVVVCELAHLSVVDTHNLSLLRSTEAEARDKVHNPEDDGSHDEGVGNASDTIGELVGELDPVAVDPATFNGCEATIEIRDVFLSKDTSEEVADNTTHTMGGKDIEAIIIAKDELELGGKVANSTGDDAKGNGGRCREMST